jgi:hypothetical protein
MLLSCDHWCNGCDGGNMNSAFSWIIGGHAFKHTHTLLFFLSLLLSKKEIGDGMKIITVD